MRSGELQEVVRRLAVAVAGGVFPGAAVAAGRGDRVVLEQGVGRLSWSRQAAAADPDLTLYDLASLTKVIATTTAVMLLVEDGKLRLDDPVADYLPNFRGRFRNDGALRVTIRDLLTHTSGLPSGSLARGPTEMETLALLIMTTPTLLAPGRAVRYSDVGFILLWEAAEEAAGEPLFRLLDRRVFAPLGLGSFTFSPGEACARCAPSAILDDGRLLKGVVHDPTARRLGGVAGSAGLFGSVHDVGRFAAMLLGGGELDGVRVLGEETVEYFTRRQPGAGTRALGWDTPDSFGRGAAGMEVSAKSFGHTGFTGTSLWIDPARGTWVVLLTNHTYEPRRRFGMQELRRSIHDLVARSALLVAPLRY